MRFSIIIPVYNVEKYIEKCMDTVMHQTFDDYEVIVVDDESPDNSMEIVQRFADAFPGKIQMLRQKNTRQGGARNNGVAHAQGEYILFVDSDDYVALNMLETVDAKLKENPCDILTFRNIRVTENGEEISGSACEDVKPGIYYPAQDKEIVLLRTGPVNKAYRRLFYLDIGMRFPEKLLYEDTVMRIAYASASSVCVCDDVLYYYVQSANSSTRREISERMLDILTVTDITIQEFQKRGLYDAFREPLEYTLIYGLLYVLDFINTIQADHPLQVSISDYLKDHFPNYRENPYIGRTLCRALDYIAERQFRRYHFEILVAGKLKEDILKVPIMRKCCLLFKKSR